MSNAQKRSKDDDELIKNLVKTNHRLERKIDEQSKHLVEARRLLQKLYDFWDSIQIPLEKEKIITIYYEHSEDNYNSKIRNRFLKIISTLTKYKFPKNGI